MEQREASSHYNKRKHYQLRIPTNTSYIPQPTTPQAISLGPAKHPQPFSPPHPSLLVKLLIKGSIHLTIPFPCRTQVPSIKEPPGRQKRSMWRTKNRSDRAEKRVPQSFLFLSEKRVHLYKKTMSWQAKATSSSPL